MASRVCSTPGCPTLVPRGARGGRCTACQRGHDRQRGTRGDRGYGPAHTKARASWQKVMDAGEVVDCWRCKQPVDPDDWQLGHDDDDRTVTRGPEHPLCNLRAAGAKGVGGGG